MRTHEVNKMIAGKIQKTNAAPEVKSMLIEVLNFERQNSDQETVKFREHYMKAIRQASQARAKR